MHNIQWLVIGGGRWARIIAHELIAMLGPEDVIRLLVDAPDKDLLNWVSSNQRNAQLRIINHIDACSAPTIGVAIVANSAYLHRVFIERAIDSGYNVISEKPLTFSLRESNYLLDKAIKLGLKIFSANTYLFADYLHIFKRNWLSGKKISRLHIDWADPQGEFRYGEQKRYDSTTPIIYDVLPHVAAIILATYGEISILESTIQVLNGGSEVELRVLTEGLLMTISLSRNSLFRKRIIHCYGPELDVTLNFTNEPGIVYTGEQTSGTPIISDADWASKRRPLAEMLYCTKSYFEGGALDDRLCISAALLGNQLIDSVAREYVEQQICFLNLERPSKNTLDLPFVYAIKEASSLRNRALEYLSDESPLHRLAIIKGNQKNEIFGN